MLETYFVGVGLRVVAEEADGELPPALAGHVSDLWSAALAESDGSLYEGRVLSLLRRDGDTLVGRFVPYSHAVAQRRDRSLFVDLQIRPVAVSGLLAVDEGLVFGLRGTGVAVNRGTWELVPSGALDPGCLGDDGALDVLEQFAREAEEELNVPAASLRGLRPFVLVHNPETHVTEIGVAGRIACDSAALHRAFAGRHNREYEELAVVPAAEADAFDGGGRGRGVDPVARVLIAAHRRTLGALAGVPAVRTGS